MSSMRPPPSPDDDRRRTLSSAFARFYAPLALVALALPFVVVFVPLPEDGQTRAAVSTWDLAAGPGHDATDQLAVALLGVLAVLLAVAAFRSLSAPARPAVVVLLALVLVLMLALRPGFSDPVPDLAAGGQAALVLGLAMIALGVAHIAALVVLRRSVRRVDPVLSR